MKKLVAGIALLLVLGTVAYFYLRPEVLMDAAPCSVRSKFHPVKFS